MTVYTLQHAVVCNFMATIRVSSKTLKYLDPNHQKSFYNQKSTVCALESSPCDGNRSDLPLYQRPWLEA